MLNQRAILLSVFLCCLPSLVMAAPNDIHLHFLYRGQVEKGLTAKLTGPVRQGRFQNLAAEFGFSIAEPILAPAETLGISGFDFGIELSVADIPELKDHWRSAIEDERPDNQLVVTRLRFRKGLPFSFELDGTLGIISGSTSFLAGFGLKWALNEGFYYFPDLSVRASVNRLFSSRDLDTLTVTLDITLSKQFPIVGTFTITPYAAYSLVYVYATSQVLDPTPKNFNDNEDATSGSSNFVFQPEHIFGSRISFGARFVWYFFSLTLEGSFTLPNFGETRIKDDATGQEAVIPAPEMISTFNMKFSFFF